MSGNRYRIEDLSERTGFSRRTIRYYIQSGLLEPPAGRGRGGFYGEGHLRRLQEIRALQDRGLRLRVIQQLLDRRQGNGAALAPQPAPAGTAAEAGPGAERRPAGPEDREVWVRYPILPGVELLVRRELEGQAGARLAETVRIARTILRRDDGKQA